MSENWTIFIARSASVLMASSSASSTTTYLPFSYW